MMQNNLRHAIIYRIIYWIMCLLKLELVKNVPLSSFCISKTTCKHFLNSDANFFFFYCNWQYLIFSQCCNLWSHANMGEAELSTKPLLTLEVQIPKAHRGNPSILCFETILSFSGFNLEGFECNELVHLQKITVAVMTYALGRSPLSPSMHVLTVAASYLTHSLYGEEKMLKCKGNMPQYSLPPVHPSHNAVCLGSKYSQV